MNANSLSVVLYGLPAWVTDSFPIIRIVLMFLIVLISLALIIVVLIQPSNEDGMGALSGQASDTFYAKNKAKSIEGALKRLTVVLGVLLIVLSILFFVTVAIYSGL